MRRAGALALAALALAACRVARPSELPRERTLVALKSCRLPEFTEWFTHFAHHGWIDAHRAGDDHWTRYEVFSRARGVRREEIHGDVAREDLRWRDREVRVLALVEGEAAERALARLPEVARGLHEKYRTGYEAWPGPNSNTFLVDVAREIPELAFEQHHNALGKDYTPWIAAGPTASRTGVRVDTLPLGVAVGAAEGVELHLLQLTFGVQLVPPRLELPFLAELPWSSSVVLPDRPSAAFEWIGAEALDRGATLEWTQRLHRGRTSVLHARPHADTWVFGELARAEDGTRVDASFTLHRDGDDERRAASALLGEGFVELATFDLGPSATTFSVRDVEGTLELLVRSRSALAARPRR